MWGGGRTHGRATPAAAQRPEPGGCESERVPRETRSSRGNGPAEPISALFFKQPGGLEDLGPDLISSPIVHSPGEESGGSGIVINNWGGGGGNDFG